MKSWNLANADEDLTRIVRQAVHHSPQRVTLADGLDVVVLSTAEYARLTGEPLAVSGADAPADGEHNTGRALLELIQNSPWAEAVRDGDWPWDWDDETRSWVERTA